MTSPSESVLKNYPTELDFMWAFSLESEALAPSDNLYRYTKSTVDKGIKFEIILDVQRCILRIKMYNNQKVLYFLVYQNVPSINIYDEKNGKGVRIVDNNKLYKLRIDLFLEPEMKYFFEMFAVD